MKTPYDPVVRVGAREMEAMREALRREMARVAGLLEYCGLDPCEPSVRAAPRMTSDLLLSADADGDAPSALFTPTVPQPTAQRADSN